MTKNKTAEYVYKDQRTGEELDNLIRWLKGYGWRMRNGHLVHPDMFFSWPWPDAERLTKEAEAGDEVARYLLEPK